MTPVGGAVEPADVIIIGAGSAGCVLADKLTRDGARSVLLLEQGPSFPDSDIRDVCRLPIGPGSAHVTTIPEASGQVVVRGRGLGGSSAVNGGYFMRWHTGDFDGWPSEWALTEIEDAYRELDDSDGTMSVDPAADGELGLAARDFERFFSSRVPVRDPQQRWPIVGLNRVPGNLRNGLRMTAADAYLRVAFDRPNLAVRTGVRVDEVIVRRRRAIGVRVGEEILTCGEVIVCAGTLGTAGLLLRSQLTGCGVDDRLQIGEHREVLVRYGRHVTGDLAPLLQTVVHTDDGIEIRCYSDDFERYVGGGRGGRPAIGVCGMRPGGTGSVVASAGGHVEVVLETPGASEQARMWSTAHDVVDMLSSNEFRDLVTPGSIVTDPVIRTSQHAWGSLPMGSATDWLGGVHGVQGLRVVDGSILPGPGRSGPHATIMMMACRIGDVLAAGVADPR